MTSSTTGLSLSSSSSSSNDQQEFRELVRAVDEARQRYSDTTREVGRLESYLDTVGVVLTASKRETAAM
jgi:hypothetical protein